MICDALFSIARLITRLCKYTDKVTSSSPWAFFFFFAKYKYKIKKKKSTKHFNCLPKFHTKKEKEKEKLAS